MESGIKVYSQASSSTKSSGWKSGRPNRCRLSVGEITLVSYKVIATYELRFLPVLLL